MGNLWVANVKNKGCICLSALYKLAAWSSCHKDNLFYSMLTRWYSAIGGNNSCPLSANQYALAKYSIKNIDKLEWNTLRIICYTGRKNNNNSNSNLVWERENLEEFDIEREWKAVISKRDQLELSWWLHGANSGQRHGECEESIFETNFLAWNLP